ncbi:MAG: phosphate ABC transporter ATP-binding protein PstB [Propionibacteriaceae bacterium]|nr:phosphate ABC transporter ATP-binding protein PstB [Propionibacteriaceae bacterium]
MITDSLTLAQNAAQRLAVVGLSAKYGDFLALSDISLSIEPRAVTAFIGPSGCGKSTLLRTINRMHEVTPGATVQGSIRLAGIDLYDPRIDPVNVRRKIGMVFQRPNPFPTMSIRENVLSGIKLQHRRLNKSDADDVVELSLRAANLWDSVKDRLNKPGASLSGGQQQRLCIARVIAVEPDVILMDEPCSALDPISTAAIEDLMLNLRRDYTVVIVTHNMQQAARVSDKTAFFTVDGTGEPGRLVEYADTEKIFSNPDEKATEDYVAGRFG